MSTLLAVVHVVVDADELLWVSAEVIQVLDNLYWWKRREGEWTKNWEGGGMDE